MAQSTKLLSTAAHSIPSAPRYRAIFDDLKYRIGKGEYAIDKQLPSERTLMEEYHASRVTVRHALQQLQEEKLVHSQKGKGHFVSCPTAVQNLGQLLGLGESLSQTGMVVTSKVLALEEAPASPEVAEALNIEMNDRVTCLQRLRYINAQPASFNTSYFPVDIGRYLSEYDLERQDLFVLIEDRLGIELSTADLVMKIGKSDKSLAARLGIEKGETVFEIERLTFDTKGSPVDFGILKGRSDTFQFHVRVPRW